MITPANPPATRSASVHDAAACAAIYEFYVTDTAVTFETEPPGPSEMATRIAASLDTHAWVVLQDEGQIRGYAYGGPFRSRAAYRWSCEVSVYVESGHRRTGVGRQLYTALFQRLCQRGYRTAVAGMTLPNEASTALHRAMGFEAVGTYRHIGYKFGAWHDVFWSQRLLATVDEPPAEPS